MRLLQSVQREVAYKKERDFAQRQAMELSSEATNLVKSFNKLKTDLESKRILLQKEYNEFHTEIDEKRKNVEEEVRILENRRDNAMIPLYEKEKELERKESYLNNKEENIDVRESDIKVREKDFKELKSVVDAIADNFDKREKEMAKKEIMLEKRIEKFKYFRSEQEKLFKFNEQKLRDWLEKERIKLKQYGINRTKTNI